MIAIIDYGLGNIRAFSNVYKYLNIPHKVASNVDDLKNITKIILPGVGAFDYAMEKVQKSGMLEILNELVLDQKIPVLGVCVGMQMMAISSEEGRWNGLGWIDGVVKKMDTSMFAGGTLLPHMGGNSIRTKNNCKLFH